MNALVKILFLRICCCYEKIEKSGKVIDILFKMEWIKYTIYDPGDYSHLNVIILYVRKFYLKLSYSLYTITLIRDLQYNITTWVVGIFEWITRLLCHLPPRVRSTSGGKWQRRSVIHEKNTNHECRNVFTTWLLVKSKDINKTKTQLQLQKLTCVAHHIVIMYPPLFFDVINKRGNCRCIEKLFWFFGMLMPKLRTICRFQQRLCII